MLASNRGRRPRETEIRDEQGNLTGFRRVRVVLANGYDTKDKEPAGWVAGGRGECRWTRTGHPFDIEQWELI